MNLAKPSFLILLFISTLSKSLCAQISIDSFLNVIMKFSNSNLSKSTLRIIRSWSDTIHLENDIEFHMSQELLKGKMILSDSSIVEFELFYTNFKRAKVLKCNGKISIDLSNNHLSVDLLSILNRNLYTNRKIKIIANKKSSNDLKVEFDFNNYSPEIESTFETFDPNIQDLLKHEYFDFYFANVYKYKIRTVGPPIEPYSEVLKILVKKAKYNEVLKLISLRNNGYSWIMAEGLWYYNIKGRFLSLDEEKFLSKFNGKNGFKVFRSPNELSTLYDD